MTIKDIARLAGVGVTTVSRALNGHPDISDETREKIQRIIKEYNYTPNQNARTLKQSAGKSILLMVKGIRSMFLSAISEGIQQNADEAGIAVSVHYLDEQADEVSVAIKLCRELKPVGIIFLGGEISNFERSFSQIKIPCVLSTASAKNLPFENLSSVSIDDFASGRKAAELLCDMGHRNVGIIRGSDEISNPSGLRLAGVKEGFRKHGIIISESQVEFSSYAISSAYEATMALCGKFPELTAVFAMADIMAIGVIRALLDMGKRVPTDVSVMGFDGIELADYFSPRITTLLQPTQKIASLSMRLLTGMIHDTIRANHIQLTPTFKPGESAAHLRRNSMAE